MPPSRLIADGLFDPADAPRLRAARCTACAQLHFPASTTCPYCGVDGATATLVGPAGTLRLFTVVASPPPGYRGPLPYGFGVVELDGVGLQVIARLTVSELAQLRPGLPVTLVVEPLFTDDDGTPVLSYAFAPAVAS
jgi:uncharacterized OB-fold protein